MITGWKKGSRENRRQVAIWLDIKRGQMLEIIYEPKKSDLTP